MHNFFAIIIGYTAEERLLNIFSDDCVCPGDVVTFECTVIGGFGTTTVWKSDIFHCSSGKQVIELVHRPVNFEQEGDNTRACNNGDIVGRIVRSENDSFTSQLNVTLTQNISGGRIECIGDNGISTHRIGSLNITGILITG